MVDFTQYAAFSQDKLQFFAKLPSEGSTRDRIAFVKDKAEQINYNFLLHKKKALEDEFTQMFAELQNQKEQNDEAFWMYCYYCATLLETSHKAYGQSGKEAEYKALKQQIRGYLLGYELQLIPKEKELKEQIIKHPKKNILYVVLGKNKSKSFKYILQSPDGSIKKDAIRIDQVLPHREEVTLENLQKVKEKILKITKQRGHTCAPQTEKAFSESLKDNFIQGVRNLMNVPFHLSEIRDWVAFSNLCRVYWVFCRLTLVSGLTLANNMQLIEKLDQILGSHTDVDKIVSTLQAPNGVLTYFSVGFFLTRFVIDAGLLIRHTFFPTKEEQQGNTSAWDRFKFEFYKRHCNFANDLGWAFINFITNFNHITKIPGPIAGAITAVFLGFDVSMMFYKMHLGKQEYDLKKAQYTQELKEYLKRLKNYPQNASIEALRAHIDKMHAHITMLKNQLAELEISWQNKKAVLYFNAAAATVFMMAFSASLLFTPPGLVVASFFACTLAAAMYFSSGAYSKYNEKKLRLEHAQLTGNDSVALKKYELARNDFIFTLAKNAVMPTFIIATFALCWPAAVVLTALSVGYELYHAYDQHHGKKEIRQMALQAPESAPNTSFKS